MVLEKLELGTMKGAGLAAVLSRRQYCSMGSSPLLLHLPKYLTSGARRDGTLGTNDFPDYIRTVVPNVSRYVPTSVSQCIYISINICQL